MQGGGGDADAAVAGGVAEHVGVGPAVQGDGAGAAAVGGEGGGVGAEGEDEGAEGGVGGSEGGEQEGASGGGGGPASPSATVQVPMGVLLFEDGELAGDEVDLDLVGGVGGLEVAAADVDPAGGAVGAGGEQDLVPAGAGGDDGDPGGAAKLSGGQGGDGGSARPGVDGAQGLGVQDDAGFWGVGGRVLGSVGSGAEGGGGGQPGELGGGYVDPG